MTMDPHSTGGRKVLIIGADLVMPKLFYFSEALGKLGYRYAVYTHDVSNESRAVAARAGAELIAGPPHRKSAGRMLKDAWTLWTSVRRRDYHHVDLYCDYHILAAFVYLLLLRAKGIPVILWCRGELYDWSDFTWWQKLYFRVAIPLSRLVILKERYMIDTLKGAGIYDADKSIELHNTVPLNDWHREAPFCEPEVRLLFLNSFKLWRNVGFCVDVAAAMREAGIPFRMTIVGDKNASQGLTDEGEALRSEIARLDLGDLVTIEGFSDDPLPFYRAHDVFLLPSDLIYCNYALLEAMREGLVPIVSSKDGDYALIVEDGVSGYGRPLEAGEWARLVAGLLADRAKAADMARAASERIRSHFSIDQVFRQYALRSGLLSNDAPATAQRRTTEKIA
jgi:glycosyltransferase involved in cell wall biosynthesis